jgi:hypothetical protein
MHKRPAPPPAPSDPSKKVAPPASDGYEGRLFPPEQSSKILKTYIVVSSAAQDQILDFFIQQPLSAASCRFLPASILSTAHFCISQFIRNRQICDIVVTQSQVTLVQVNP